MQNACRRSQQKDPESGMSASSRTQVIIKISEDKMKFEKSAVETKEQSENYPKKLKPKTSSSKTQALFVDVDLPNNEACTVIEIMELSSLSNSFGCSSISESSNWNGTTTFTFVSSVSLLELTSKPKIPSQPISLTSPVPDLLLKTPSQSLPLPPANAMSEPKNSSGSPISLSAINLIFQQEVPTEAPAPVTEIRLTLEPKISTSDLSTTPTATCALKETVVSTAETSSDWDSIVIRAAP